MDDEQFNAMKNSLSNAIRRFPNCKIANCNCDSKHGKRIEDCYCLCHIEDIRKEWLAR